ncbi:hypothetical protein RHDC4_00028 [Rhodocyclaceae bacterium]|nr:hypothetical protein RHDC4_00028 [Rhodocyclaceae bacterium]
MSKRKGVHPSRDGKTVGITLRIDQSLLEAYDKVAARANIIDLERGGRGKLTTQDVMRHRLASAPAVRRKGESDV